jgi:O-methyltransferase
MKSLLPPPRLMYLLERLQFTKDIKGDVIEVGVYEGGALLHMAKLALAWEKKITGYDTFLGLPPPEAIDLHKEGSFKNQGKDRLSNEFKKQNLDVELVAGLYPQTGINNKVSFCHLDVDLYRSTLDSLKYLSRVMNPGGLVVVDDYKSYTCPGVLLAVSEVLDDEALGFSVQHEGKWQVTLIKN